MQIPPRHRWLRPIDWRELSASIRLRRRLKPPHSVVERTGRTRVVLATFHLDHDPTNNAAGNLAALCQRCHILHDKAEHLRRRRLTYLARRAVGDLFTGPYR